jgi:hypothetical protein
VSCEKPKSNARNTKSPCDLLKRTIEEHIAGMVLVAFAATQNDIMVVWLKDISWNVLDRDNSGVHCFNHWLVKSKICERGVRFEK